MQLKVAICEDDKMICEDIQRRILEIRSDYTIDRYFTGEELLLADIGYDMVFLDVEMPGRDGIDIARKLREKKYYGQIVFLTNHKEFMSEAFKVKAFRFLENPVKMEELDETLAEAEKEIFMDKKLIVIDYGTEILINISDILYVKAKKNKTLIYTRDAELETNFSLKYWLQELGDMDFFKVHKSYIVSLRQVKAFDGDCVILHGSGVRIPVSRRNTSLVKKVFFDYIRAKTKYM